VAKFAKQKHDDFTLKKHSCPLGPFV